MGPSNQDSLSEMDYDTSKIGSTSEFEMDSASEFETDFASEFPLDFRYSYELGTSRNYDSKVVQPSKCWKFHIILYL